MKTPLPRLKQLVLPGLVFQSVVIAGGYGTGRELVEFFLTQGPSAGLLAMGMATLVWSAVGMVTFELARMTESYDYRSFTRELMGPAWALYEAAYLAMLLLVLGVVAAAAGAIVRDTFSLPYMLGVAGMMGLVGFLTLKGSDLIEGFLTLWSLLLYGTYATFAVWAMVRLGPDIRAALSAPVAPGADWVLSGVRYAAYNIGILPAVLFVLRGHRSRRITLGAGVLVGPLAMIPALLFYVALLGVWPEVVDREVPAGAALEALGSPAFRTLFQLVLLGTLVETGTGLIHAVNERLDHRFQERGRSLPRWGRPALAVAMLGLASALSSFGLIRLIERGYGVMTWVFLLVFVIPVLTLGSRRILRGR